MKMSSYQVVLQKRKKSMIIGRCDRYIYINAREQLGKDSFMNTWQLLERLNHSYKENLVKINIKEVFLIKGDEKNWES